MPKKVSKSISQKVNQKQTVTINLPTPKSSRRRRSTKVKVVAPINTGTSLLATVVPSGFISQSGRAFKDPLPQYHHGVGRLERTIDDLYSHVDRSRFIPSDPKPIVQPIDQPQAFDYGFVNKSESPMPFLENSIRRTPVKMEDIPIPQQGMFVSPVIDSDRRGISIDNDLANRLMDLKPERKLELRKRIDEAMSGGKHLSYADALKQQREIQRQMDAAAYGLPFPSPYEEAESKVEFK